MTNKEAVLFNSIHPANRAIEVLSWVLREPTNQSIAPLDPTMGRFDLNIFYVSTCVAPPELHPNSEVVQLASHTHSVKVHDF